MSHLCVGFYSLHSCIFLLNNVFLYIYFWLNKSGCVVPCHHAGVKWGSETSEMAAEVVALKQSTAESS